VSDRPFRRNQLPAKERGVSSPLQRRQVFYSGHVQGVGFRYTTRQIAGNYEVTGFVRNLPDGRVELVAEGTEAELTAFLTAVDERLGSHIRSTAIDRRDATSEFSRFQITH
jgi:acylphosphatase